MKKVFFIITVIAILAGCSESVGEFNRNSDSKSLSPQRENVDPNSSIDGIDFEFVAIPYGCFAMGSCPSEYDRHRDEDKHRVMIDDFYLGKYEVTQAQWQLVMGNNPSHFKGENLPVDNVSWEDVQIFISKLNELTGKTYRLPTEAEWEYACRAGTQTPFYTGENLTTEQANYNGQHPYKNYPRSKCLNKSVQVGSYSPNPWGLYDMMGNVWEWCSDWYGKYDTSIQVQLNPTGAEQGTKKVFRGGSWISRARYCRSANRFYGAPDYKYFNLGFRLAMSKATYIPTIK